MPDSVQSGAGDTAHAAMPVIIDGSPLPLATLNAIAEGHRGVRLAPTTRRAIADCHERLRRWSAGGRPLYGVNTGFGEMASVLIPVSEQGALQRNLIRSHAVCAGEPLPPAAARASLLARLMAFARGHSGVSPETADLMAGFLNAGLAPQMPRQGSLGASGDLGPLAHIALNLLGEGEIWDAGAWQPAANTLTKYGLRPLDPGPKEGLALCNGTSAMTGTAVTALMRAWRLLNWAVIGSALTQQVLGASLSPLAAHGHALKAHAGQGRIAAALRGLNQGATWLTDDHAVIAAMQARSADREAVENTNIIIQNAYTLRCVPQILGPVLDHWRFAADTVEREAHAVDDNPVLFSAFEESFQGGHFHGQYVAMACDSLAIAIAELGVLADRQIERLLDPKTNGGLPPFLAAGRPGLNCGFEGAQYRATSIASENIGLTAPDSVRSLPANGGNQDVVSMGLNAANRCLRLCDNVSRILSVLLLAGAQASALRESAGMSPALADHLNRLPLGTLPYTDTHPLAQQLDTISTELLAPAHDGALAKVIATGDQPPFSS